MMKKLTALFCFVQVVYSAPSSPYQYKSYSTGSSTPAYVLKQSMQNLDLPPKYAAISYKGQDGASAKVKKEYSNSEYHNVYTADPDTPPQPYSPEFTSYDENFSNTPANVTPFPYTAKLNPIAQNLYVPPLLKTYAAPAVVSTKAFPPHDYKPHHLLHDVLGHYITNVASHKLKHVGEALESGALTEPIIHKLTFAKAALLQLLAILGPLSAIKTLHVVAKTSNPHHLHHPTSEHEIPPPLPEIVPVPDGPVEIEPYTHHPYGPPIVQMILQFVAQLSKFNKESKLHLIPNLLRLVSYASSSSTHVSGHHPY